MSQDLVTKTGDSAPSQTVRLNGRDGANVNLTGATVVMQLRNSETSIPCDIVVASEGTVQFTRDGLPAATSVTWVDVEFEVTYSDGTVQTFPEEGYVKLYIYPGLDAL